MEELIIYELLIEFSVRMNFLKCISNFPQLTSDGREWTKSITNKTAKMAEVFKNFIETFSLLAQTEIK